MEIIKKITIIICTIFFSSCSSIFYCYLSSVGTFPQDRTYYITANDTSLNETLEYKEYFNCLRIILNDLGYIEADSISASLKIEFSYRIGEQKVHKDRVHVLQAVNTYTPSTYSSGRISFSTTNTSFVPTSLDVETVKFPLCVDLCVFDNTTNTPIWEMTIWDEVERETQIPSVMPYLLVCAKDYFGMNSQGEKMVKIDRFATENRYGFAWPYQ